LNRWDAFFTAEAVEFQRRTGAAMARKLECDMGRIMAKAMVEEQDRVFAYMDFALTPAALLGGPVVLGFEE